MEAQIMSVEDKALLRDRSLGAVMGAFIGDALGGWSALVLRS